MPKNPVTDPISSSSITDQEVAFACLILSGAMNDRRAAEAVGLDPSAAAHIKSKPRVRAYMFEHRATVSERPIEQEAEGQRNLDTGRDQIRNRILDRLWQLANVNPEATRGSIAGQIKAISMIIAIEGLIPDRRRSPVPTQPASPPVQAQIYVSDRIRRRREAQATEPGGSVAAVEAQPAAPPVPKPLPPAPSPSPTKNAPPTNPNQTSLGNPFEYPKGMNWVPEVNGRVYDADVHPAGSLRLAMPPRKNPFARGR